MAALAVLARHGPGQGLVERAPVVEGGQTVVIGDVARVIDHLPRVQRARSLVGDDGEDALGGRIEGAALPGEDQGPDRLLLRAQGQGQQRLRARAALVEDEDGHAVPAPLQVVQEETGLVGLEQPGRPRPLQHADLSAFELVGPALRVLDDVAGLGPVGEDDRRPVVRDQLTRAAQEPHADGDGVGQVGDLA
jgi:hypothetical protein